MITSPRRVLGILGLLLALVPCAPRVLAQTAPTDNAAVWQALNRMPAADRRAVLEREARREGTLVLYGATGLDRAQFWIGEFNKRYPDIKVEFVRLQAAELYQKIAAERRTGQLRADLVITTITYLDLLKDAGAFAPYEPVTGPTSIRASGWAATTRAGRRSSTRSFRTRSRGAPTEFARPMRRGPLRS